MNISIITQLHTIINNMEHIDFICREYSLAKSEVIEKLHNAGYKLKPIVKQFPWTGAVCKESCQGLKYCEGLVIKKIKHYIDIFKSEYTYIAFDGVPPYAKIKQQRTRRYKSYITKHLLDQHSGWNRCSITPGTHFMSKLNKELQSTFNDANLYYLSTSSMEGEAEHKIFSYIRSETNMLSNKNIVLFGLDADLIMLSLYHLKYVNNILLYRDSSGFSTIKNDRDNVMDIFKLQCVIHEKLEITITVYMFICFLLGNDFLPHFPSLNIRKHGIDKIAKVFRSCNIKLVSEELYPKIIWNDLRIFVEALAKSEVSEFKSNYSEKIKQRQVFSNFSNEEKLVNLPSLDCTLELCINPFTDKWNVSYYKHLFDIDINIDSKSLSKICLNYMEGLEWVLNYYTGNIKVDWSWCYRYLYPPLLQDLVKYVPFYDTSFIKKRSSEFTEVMLLCYVIPKDSIELIPKNIQLKLNKELYRDDCQIIWAYCKYFWESHPILNDIDINELKLAVS